MPTVALHPVVERVTARITERSRVLRNDYLARMDAARQAGPYRYKLSCGNQAHGFAASGDDKPALRYGQGGNLGIVTAYNDMLSAHQPMEHYPALIRMAARNMGGSAQVAGGVPAMCDGVTQGRAGMELSLFSRDVIAMATAVALSHDTFDAALMLGVCDKIVPGLLIGALSFGHLPVIFVPAGPMPSGIPNKQKAEVRQRYALGQASQDELMDAEAASYHAPGTCTFYGTANSNQMLMEVMGLHLPGTAFVPPNTPLRSALTVAAAEQALRSTALGDAYRPLAHVVSEKAIVNAMVGLAATGGSTNHALHLVAVARAAGIVMDWGDLDELSKATPLLARVYPNGSADVNHFEAAGGIGFVIRELLDAGLLHADVLCVHGGNLRQQTQQPYLDDLQLCWRDAPAQSQDSEIVRGMANPFDSEGGLRCLQGNLGRAIVKVSAVALPYRKHEAPVRIFDSQDALIAAFKAGQLDKSEHFHGDFIAVVRGQGPRANGMPELHKLTPTLAALQDRGQRVALLTDGRMSGASGKVLAAIHVTPEAVAGGALAKLREGDLVRIDAEAGTMDALVDAVEWAARSAAPLDSSGNQYGMGRELFGLMRGHAGSAEHGASALLGAVE
ncbi:phosphogluconate dehydratase [Thermomonas sp.]|uniref:phosphogluconate dehydratase n=1 Tax=Thermomonas sp. TaxID=1971895 RepID=UPI002593FCE7|nr:phosphogluconate dehydratase [Thermomonas sp.]HOC11059.1 phosphogluconate dehydratase [Thermomonas sp.]HQA02154.1 phosphogluconate dehydratase [Thermomonas sp.]HQE07656.1 phosphogluconate dehydratase [Thermomonas sp.]